MPSIRYAQALKKQRLPTKISWDYVPHARQLEFHNHPAKYKLYGGAVGGGKSLALCAEAIIQSLRNPGNRGFFCRQILLDFIRSTLVTFEKCCPSAFIKAHYRQDRIILLQNGSEILYGGLGEEKDIERIKSTEFGWFAIDEATETSSDMFMMLQSRLRWRLPNGSVPDYVGVLASNPEPGWVKEFFVDQRRDNFAFIQALPGDNPNLPDGYLSSLRDSWPREWIRRYLQGSWEVFEGQIYKEFDKERHVYNDAQILLAEKPLYDPTKWKFFDHYRTIDYGLTNPTACLWAAIDFSNNIYIYDEHYEADQTIDWHAMQISAKHPEFNGPTICDPTMFNTTMQKAGRRWSPADEFRENGIIVMKAFSGSDWMSEGSGINLVRQRLRANSIYIHERCVNLLREIVKYKWKTLKANERERKNAPESPVDYDNHALDALRYLCMFRPLSSGEPKKPQIIPGSFQHERLKHLKRYSGEQYIGWN